MKNTLLIILSLLSICSFAQDQTPEEKKEPNCVQIDFGRTEIGCLKQNLGSFTAIERKNKLLDKLNALSLDHELNAENVTIVPNNGLSNIVANESILIGIHNGDFEISGSEEHSFVAPIIVERVRQAITNDRKAKSPAALINGLIFSVIATIALAVWFLFLRWLYPRLYSKSNYLAHKYVGTLKIQSFELINAVRVTGFISSLIGFSRVALVLIGLYIYIPLVFSFFPWTSNWADKLFGFILNPLKTFATVFVNYIPNLFFVIVIIVITRYLLSLVKFFFREVELGHLHFEGFYKEWALPTYKLVRVLVIAFAFIMAFPYLPGSNSPAFQGVSVFLGILISFGSSSAIGNIVAGIVITYMRPFRHGDRVKIADTVGDVIEKNLLVTRVRTIKNVDITVPNSIVLSNHIVNYSAACESEGLILNTTVSLGYDVSWRTVHELLIDAATRTDGIMKEKKPFILQTALNDFYVSYELNAYTRQATQMASIYSKLHENIQECFGAAKIEILSPHYRAVRLETHSENTLRPTT